MAKGKGKPRKKCTATIKKVGNHFNVETHCSLAKMVRATKASKGRKKHRKPSGCAGLSKRACAEMKRIEAKEYRLPS